MFSRRAPTRLGEALVLRSAPGPFIIVCRSDSPQLWRRFRLQTWSKNAYYFTSVGGGNYASLSPNEFGGLYERVGQS